jgi:hypothetical protein
VVEPVSVGVIVAALLAKALNRAEDGVIDSGVEVARKGIEALRERFSRKGDTEAEQALESLAETPDSERRERVLAALLERRARESAELHEELNAIAEQIEETGVRIGDIKQEAKGTNIAQVAGNPGSQISINQGASSRPHE